MENEQTIYEKKISVAVFIRKIVFDLNSQLTEFINSNSLETKQRFGTYIVNTHKKIKMLLKFLNVIKNSKKLEEIQKLTEYVIRDKAVFYDMSADFFIKVSNLRLQKTPDFNIRKAVSIMCFNRYDIISKEILHFIVNNSIDYYTIRKNDINEIFEFEQKFHEGVRECCIDRYKTIIKLKLRSHVILQKFQDKINKESLVEHDYYLSFEIGSFFIFNFLFLPKDSEYFTYQVSEIKINPKESVFKLTEEQTIGFINSVNFDLINKNLPLRDKSQDNDIIKDPYIHLNEVLNIFKLNIRKFLLPIFFKKLQELMEKILIKMYKKISNVVMENEEILICFKFDQKLDNYFIKISHFIENNRIFVKILYSHKVIKKDYDIIFIREYKEIINFSLLNETDFEMKIYESINDFYSIQNYIILSNLKVYQSNELELDYAQCGNKISCFLRKNYLLFSLFLDNKGELSLIDETKNMFNQSDKHKILEFIGSLNNNNFISINYTQINSFYLYIFNLIMKRRFILLPESFVVQNNDDFIVNFTLFDSIFVENHSRKKRCLLRFFLSRNQPYVKRFLIIQTNNQEAIYDSKDEKNLRFEGVISIDLLENLYKIAQNFKRNYHTNLQLIFEVLNFGKIELSNNLETVTLKNIDLGTSYSKIQEYNEFYEKIEINLKRCLLFKIILTNKFKERYEGNYLRSFYHQEMEFQIDYNVNKNEINLGVISKLNTKRPDFNDIRKFFSGILQKIFMIMARSSNICKSAEFKYFLNNYCPKSFISPLSLDIRMINGDLRKNLSFQNYLDLKENKMVKVINSATKSINFTSYNELFKSMFEDLGDKFVENIRNFNFYNMMIEKLFLRFSHTFLNPRIYDFISNQENSLFMIPKNYKTFHFISKNNISFILEFFELNKIKIYSTNFVGYENNSRRLIDAMLNNPNSGNTNGSTNIILKKGVIYEIDPLNMENEIRMLIEMIEQYSITFGNTCN